jgi:hypothetical protein
VSEENKLVNVFIVLPVLSKLEILKDELKTEDIPTPSETWNLLAGDVVPIPTFPLSIILMRSARVLLDIVLNTKSVSEATALFVLTPAILAAGRTDVEVVLVKSTETPVPAVVLAMFCRSNPVAFAPDDDPTKCVTADGRVVPTPSLSFVLSQKKAELSCEIVDPLEKRTDPLVKDGRVNLALIWFCTLDVVPFKYDSSVKFG